MFTDEQFTRLAKTYIDTVFRVALNYLKSGTDADDVTQNVFLKLWKEKKPFDSEEHIRNWLIRVTINECKSLLRSPWRSSENIEDYARTLSFVTPEHSELFYAVMELPKKYRMPIYLYYYEGYVIERNDPYTINYTYALGDYTYLYYTFNRLIDVDKIEAVIINDYEFANVVPLSQEQRNQVPETRPEAPPATEPVVP